MKRCNRCNIEKELECFYISTSNGGPYYICKSCEAKRQAEKRLQSKKDCMFMLSKELGRYPTVTEILYFERTGQVKKAKHFTTEEKLIYNPGPAVLERTYKSLLQIMCAWYNKDKIKAKLERESIKAERSARIEARGKDLRQLKWEASEERKQGFFKRKGSSGTQATAGREREINKIIQESGKENARRVLEYHLNHGDEPSPEMKAITDKYK